MYVSQATHSFARVFARFSVESLNKRSLVAATRRRPSHRAHQRIDAVAPAGDRRRRRHRAALRTRRRRLRHDRADRPSRQPPLENPRTPLPDFLQQLRQDSTPEPQVALSPTGTR